MEPFAFAVEALAVVGAQVEEYRGALLAARLQLAEPFAAYLAAVVLAATHQYPCFEGLA